MLDQPGDEKLATMRLYGMLKALRDQRADPESIQLSFDERMALLIEAELLYRDNHRRTRLLKEAKLRIPTACIENIDCTPERGLAKATVRQLAPCGWLNDHRNLLITGATGTGKTWLACAFGNQACRLGYRVHYRRLPRLLEEFRLAQADGTRPALLARLARIDLLVLDDWGIGTLDDPERHHLLELFEDRYGLRSTLVTSQLPVENWHDYLGEPTIADAILDRLIHNAHKLKLLGPSRRKEGTTVPTED